MSTECFVRVRVDQQLKDEATAVLARMGLSISDLLRLTMRRVIQDQALPFQVRASVPSEEPRAG